MWLGGGGVPIDLGACLGNTESLEPVADFMGLKSPRASAGRLGVGRGFVGRLASLAPAAKHFGEPTIAIHGQRFASPRGALDAMIARHHDQAARGGIGADQLFDQIVGVGLAGRKTNFDAAMPTGANAAAGARAGVEHDRGAGELARFERFGQTVEQAPRVRWSVAGPMPRARIPLACSRL